MENLKQFIENEQKDILNWFNIEANGETETHPDHYEPYNERENRLFDAGMYTAFDIILKQLNKK